MLTSDMTFFALTLLSGICWTVTYLLIIKKGFADKVYGMPLTAIGINISWEFIYSFLIYDPHQIVQLYINRVWFTLDIVIFIQALFYGRRDFKYLSPILFFSGLLLILVFSFCIVLLIEQMFKDGSGCVYSAFIDNFIMSALFIAMLIRRNSISGQSIYIAIFKMIGTLAASLVYYSKMPTIQLLNFLYIAIFILDIIYIILIRNWGRIK